MIKESKLMPQKPREPTARESVLSGRYTFLPNWKAVLSVLMVSGGLLGSGQEATAGTDWGNSGGGSTTQNQNVIPQGGGWVTPSQGWVTPSQGWVTPSQGWVTPSQGWVTPNQNWGTSNQNWGTPNQNWGTPNQGWNYRDRGNRSNR
jgi:hypothetical protein